MHELHDSTPALRVSDADRERAAAVLREAAADGRLATGELNERLDLVYGARTTGELAAAVRDLQRPQGGPTAAEDVGVLSDFARRGPWVVGAEYRATAVVAAGVVDLREARFTGPETTIRVQAWIGTVHVVVPEGVEVCVEATRILGDFHQDRETAHHPAARRITVIGTAVCGSVFVVHDLPPAQERRLRKRERRGLPG
ncbi:DUF1707 domain-containing protein [Kitasatospora sp. NPDC098652]|uniref:DUF1707 SHOCT-like domain-containing protein n=1 Tax=Kitasatospora sp. NPDC098652 TaxID=3364095 RepID=UPI00382D44AB